MNRWLPESIPDQHPEVARHPLSAVSTIAGTPSSVLGMDMTSLLVSRERCLPILAGDGDRGLKRI